MQCSATLAIKFNTAYSLLIIKKISLLLHFVFNIIKSFVYFRTGQLERIVSSVTMAGEKRDDFGDYSNAFHPEDVFAQVRFPFCFETHDALGNNSHYLM